MKNTKFDSFEAVNTYNEVTAKGIKEVNPIGNVADRVYRDIVVASDDTCYVREFRGEGDDECVDIWRCPHAENRCDCTMCLWCMQ